ncbi:hypothetical protein THASP1DRAFT_30154 [Thamnocephalis sphaerospora]|uniref:Uncharacterized protein n=1 Tax=Thamnocephalis sphaerospora TaxID=78915 RepID=A0A4V1IWM1_9FUNG|nr:hypothetical protein THASP1DRAFT_30154 [Thamnocephalis sphaerospora]|eukprot:RKP08039.1 hypothetical protein THASP1DRAFT_30154 [Thamnocephalis sphaerospora]
MASLRTMPTGSNAFLMVAVVPLPAKIHSWLGKSNSASTNNVSKAMPALPPKSVHTAPAPPAPQPAPTQSAPCADIPADKADGLKSALPHVGGLYGAAWQVIRRLQSAVSEEDCQVARNVFSVDDNGDMHLSLPFNWPELPHYATREGMAEALVFARKHMPAFIGTTACAAGIAYRQPGLSLRYAAHRMQTGLYPWLGSGLARIAARPAALIAAAGGLPVLLAALPAYYLYLVLGEAVRVASELGTDLSQLSTVVQLVTERCEPVFRAADGLPADVALRVIALGLKQHLPSHVASVVKQAVYFGRHTGSMSSRLIEVLEAAAEWAHGEQGRNALDQLVRMTEPSGPAYGQDAPRAA